MDPNLSTTPLPPSWPDHVKSAFLQALGMAHTAMAHIRGRCIDGAAAEVNAVDSERLRSEVELLREELRIKDARMARVPARRRPRYCPGDRLAILQLKASRGWNEQQAASAFLISAATIAGWLKRVDEKGTAALIQVVRPVNRYPDFVDHLVQLLKLSFPAMGKVRIAQLLKDASCCTIWLNARNRKVELARGGERFGAVVGSGTLPPFVPSEHVSLSENPWRLGEWMDHGKLFAA
jgi:hypothetical protein